MPKMEAKWIMSQKFEAFQTLMMAASEALSEPQPLTLTRIFTEANFYGSLPVFANNVKRLNQTTPTPVDLVVSGFTLMGAAMVVSD